MKKTISLLIFITILILPLNSLAINIPGYEGGIENELIYKEVIFVTGQPILMEGKLSIKRKEKGNEITETYKYTLENKALEAELRRDITLKEILEPKGKQIISTKTLEKYKETIQVDGKTYIVEDNHYQWNQGSITHKTPLLDYYAGDYLARKTYNVDGGQGVLTVDSTGNLVGYTGPWSTTETQTIEYILDYEDKLNIKNNWQGTATAETSYNQTKDYSYAENIPNYISFRGGFRVTQQEESILKYKYNLPKIINNNVMNGRNLGTSSLSLETNPNITRLNIPALRDVIGHKYENELLLLASMEAIPLNSVSIEPSASISRGDFARALVESMDIPIEEEESNTSRRSSRRNKEEVQPLFKDVSKDHINFKYIEEIGKRKIMSAQDNDKFYPDKPLTRMEAYTIIVRILGFEHLAPIGNYSLGYKDQNNIPTWAKDYIYVAKELGFIERSDYLYPTREITKGEGARLIVDLIDYMQTDLRHNYRENILNN